MAYEKRWPAVAPKLLTADGTTEGLVQVTDAIDFHVKQIVYLKDSNGLSKRVQINSILSQTEIIVGEVCSRINATVDVSAFTTALNATMSSDIQKRPEIPQQEFERASFEEEPVVAKRVVQVDSYGNKYTKDNPFPVDASVSVTPSKVNVGRITKIEINPTTWTLLERSASTSPTGLGPLADRCVMLIQNFTGESIILQYDDGTTDNTISITLPDCAERAYDYDPSVKFYAKSTASTVEIVIEEGAST